MQQPNSHTPFRADVKFDNSLLPANPMHRVGPEVRWPTRFALFNTLFPFERSHPAYDSFNMEVFHDRTDGPESLCEKAWRRILNNFCPDNHVISTNPARETFSAIQEGHQNRESYASAAGRYRTERARVIEGHPSLTQTLSSSSNVSNLSETGEHGYETIRNTSLGGTNIRRVTATPQEADIYLSGRTHTFQRSFKLRPYPQTSVKEPTSLAIPSPQPRTLFLVEIKPRKSMKASRCQVAFVLQSIRQAIIGCDMFGCLHSMYCQGMWFRRMVRDPRSNDIYVDIGQSGGQGGEQSREVIEMTLDVFLTYGYVVPEVRGDEGVQAGEARETSPLDAFLTRDNANEDEDNDYQNPSAASQPPLSAGVDPSTLFYKLAPDLDPGEWESTASSRHALTSFLIHMGQSHFDVCRDTEEPLGEEFDPLGNLTGKWAKISGVTLEEIANLAGLIALAWNKKDKKAKSGKTSEGGAKSDKGAGGGTGDGKGGQVAPATGGETSSGQDQDSGKGRASTDTIRQTARQQGTETHRYDLHPFAAFTALQSRLETGSDANTPSLVHSVSDHIEGHIRASRSFDTDPKTTPPSSPLQAKFERGPSLLPLDGPSSRSETHDPPTVIGHHATDRLDYDHDGQYTSPPLDLESTMNAEQNGQRMKSLMMERIKRNEVMARRFRLFECIPE